MLRVERTEAAVPDGAADLVADLYRRMPEARITDILLEVDDATRFTEAFMHLRTGEPCRDRIGLLNVLLAEGINLGLRKMAEATTTHGFWFRRLGYLRPRDCCRQAPRELPSLCVAHRMRRRAVGGRARRQRHRIVAVRGDRDPPQAVLPALAPSYPRDRAALDVEQRATVR